MSKNYMNIHRMFMQDKLKFVSVVLMTTVVNCLPITSLVFVGVCLGLSLHRAS